MGTTLQDVIRATDDLFSVAPGLVQSAGPLAELALLAGEVAASRDAPLMAAARSRLGRCSRRLASRNSSGDSIIVEALESLGERLSRAITEADVRAESERRTREALDFRSRILAELQKGAVRPRDLAEAFQVDPSQVSRAMRLLREEGKIELVPLPRGEEDRRSRFYRLASSRAVESGPIDNVLPTVARGTSASIDEVAVKGEMEHPSIAPTCVVVDDHGLFRAALSHLLNSNGLRVVGDYESCAAALTHGVSPQVVFIDAPLIIGLRGAESLDAVRGSWPDVQIVVMTAIEDPDEARQLMAAGARGYLPKSASVDEVVEAVHRVLEGDAHLRPSFANEIRSREAAPGRDRPTISGAEILDLVADGNPHREIDEMLLTSVTAVATHLANIREAIHVDSRRALTSIGFESAAAISHLRELRGIGEEEARAAVFR